MNLIRAARQKDSKFHIDFHCWGIDLRILSHAGVSMVNFGINWEILRIIIGEISYKLSIINYAPLKMQSNSGYDLELHQDVLFIWSTLSWENIDNIGNPTCSSRLFPEISLFLYSLLFFQKPTEFWFGFVALGTQDSDCTSMKTESLSDENTILRHQGRLVFCLLQRSMERMLLQQMTTKH